MRFFSVFIFTLSCATLFAQQSEWQDYIEKKQFDEIIAFAGDLQPADSADFTKMYLIGQAYEGLLKYKDAYNFYTHCYLLDSTRIDMLNTLARIAVNLGKVKEAESYYLKVLDSDSANFFANYQLARLYVSLENYEKGLYYYGLLLEKYPENSVILRAVGDCFSLLNLSDAALEFYREAYKANVENASLASLLINTLLKLNIPMFNKYIDEALAVCDTALFYNPEHKTLRQNKAMAYFVKTEYLKADTLYTSLMAEKDSSYNTLKYCGFTRYYAQNWLDAIEPLEKAYVLDTAALDVCLILGICLGRTYDPNQAFQYFDKAENLMAPPYWSELLIQFKAEIFLKTGNCNKGAELYYQLWMKDDGKLSWLQQMQRCYAYRPFDDLSDDERQRYLFINFLYATEILKNPRVSEMSRELTYLHSVLKKFEVEMFFRAVDSLPMTSPDNKKNTLSLAKLKELTSKLSEY